MYGDMTAFKRAHYQKLLRQREKRLEAEEEEKKAAKRAALTAASNTNTSVNEGPQSQIASTQTPSAKTSSSPSPPATKQVPPPYFKFTPSSIELSDLDAFGRTKYGGTTVTASLAREVDREEGQALRKRVG